MHSEIATKKSRVYDGSIVKLDVDEVVLENGKFSSREVVRHPGGAAVLAVDDNEDLFFVRQFRYPYGEEMIEIPAGKLNEGEDPLTCAKRELLEETGLVAEKWEKIGAFRPSPGYTSETIHLYIARELSEREQHLDDDEFLDVVKFNAIKAMRLIEKGEITDAKTVIAIYKYVNER